MQVSVESDLGKQLAYWAYHIAESAHGPYIYNLRLEGSSSQPGTQKFTYTQARKDDILYREYDVTLDIPDEYINCKDYKGWKANLPEVNINGKSLNTRQVNALLKILEAVQHSDIEIWEYASQLEDLLKKYES